MSHLTQDRLDREIEQARKRVRTLESAINALNKSSNSYLGDLARQAQNDLKDAKRRLEYWVNIQEGPWMDKDGRIERGYYEGFYIIPLLKALANSAKDFPTAMGMIADSVNDPAMAKQSFTMYPREDLKSKTAYGLLMEMAPNVKWEQVEDLFWDT